MSLIFSRRREWKAHSEIMKNRIYWPETLSGPPLPIKPDPLADTYDVAVIGGGLTGLSAACHLALKGCSVVVLEASRVGQGASSRNAGMAMTGLTLFPQELIARYGHERALGLYCIGTAAVDFLEAWIHNEKIDCDFKRYGALCAAYTRRHVKDLVNARRLLLDTFGHETLLVEPKDLSAELGSPLYHGALVDPISAGLNPAKLVHGILKRISETGVCVSEERPVQRISQSNHHFKLETPRGTVRAESVIVATNGYTPAWLKFLRRRVIPVASFIVVTEPLPLELARELIPQGRMVYDTKHLLYYFRRVDGNRLLFGGRVSFGKTDDRIAAAKLHNDMQEVFPQLKPYRVEYYWSGKLGFTFDRMPHIGQQAGLYYALGYCGHGVALSVYFGYMLARMAVGEPVDLPFIDLPFATRFYYRKTPWFLPLAGAFYKAIDRLGR